MRNFYRHFLRDQRLKRKLSATDLSLRIGVALPILYRIERGEQLPDYFQAKKLADFFDFEWHDVMERCVQFQEKTEKHQNLFKKLSESMDGSNDCVMEGRPCAQR